MSRETKSAKADRLLVDGHVVLERVTAGAVVAIVRGTGTRHRVTWMRGQWGCTCEHRARTTPCSHLVAVRRVVAVDLEERDQ